MRATYIVSIVGEYHRYSHESPVAGFGTIQKSYGLASYAEMCKTDRLSYLYDLIVNRAARMPRIR